MVTEDFAAVSRRRAARARELAAVHRAAREPLLFFGVIAEFQAEIATQTREWENLPALRTALVERVVQHGTELLIETAKTLSDDGCRRALDEYWRQSEVTSPASFFARVLLQPYAATARVEATEPPAAPSESCPLCGHPPQVGVLRSLGDGHQLTLGCSLCLREWECRRGTCPACGESDEKKLVYYSTPNLEAVQVSACESCRFYLQTVDLARVPSAIPDVDEIAALPLDVWAREQGYRKFHPNLVGI